MNKNPRSATSPGTPRRSFSRWRWPGATAPRPGSPPSGCWPPPNPCGTGAPGPWRQLGLARALLLEGDDGRAECVTHDALKMFADNGWRPGVIDALDILAEIALFQRKHERAVRLSAAAQTQRGILGLVPFPQACQRAEEQRAAAGDALGAGSRTRFPRRGRACRWPRPSPTPSAAAVSTRAPRHGWASLSPVERQVVDLASNGVNNPTIATELFMSRNTVKAHLSHAYAKLGVTNRIELVRLAARRGADADRPEQLYPRG